MRCLFTLTSEKVNYNQDAVDWMVREACQKYTEETQRQPSEEQIRFLSKEIFVYLVIRRDYDTASKLRISERFLLS